MKLRTLALIPIVSWLAFTNAEKNKLNKLVNFCYYPSYASYVVSPANTKTEYCTHVGFSFFRLAPDGTCFLANSNLDGNVINGLIAKKSSSTKVCASIGGGKGSSNFGAVAKSIISTQNMINTCSALMNQYLFDNCFEVDWGFPLSNEKDAFVDLLKAVKRDMPGVELFTSLNPGRWQSDISYDIPRIAAIVDYINLMTYDYHGPWKSQIGHNSPLKGPSHDANIVASVYYFISKGTPPNKILIGIPFYGRTFTLINSNSSIGAPSKGGDPLEYNKFCQNQSQWSIGFDNLYGVPYAVKDDTWYTYDNPKSIAYKTKYVINNNLGGTFIWSLQQDDTQGVCGPAWPLLTAVYKGLYKSSASSPAPRHTSVTISAFLALASLFLNKFLIKLRV